MTSPHDPDKDLSALPIYLRPDEAPDPEDVIGDLADQMRRLASPKAARRPLPTTVAELLRLRRDQDR